MVRNIRLGQLPKLGCEIAGTRFLLPLVAQNISRDGELFWALLLLTLWDGLGVFWVVRTRIYVGIKNGVAPSCMAL